MKKIITLVLLIISFNINAAQKEIVSLESAKKHMENKEYNIGLKYYTQLAKNDNDVAQLNLGIIYLTGTGVAKNLKKSFDWTEQSAWNGNLDAINNLSQMYHTGVGVEKNIVNALYYYQMGALLGNPVSQLNYGLENINAEYLQVDKVNAYMWIYLSAKSKTPKSNEYLQKLNKIINKKDIDEAILRAENFKSKDFNKNSAPKEIKAKLKDL